MLEAWNGNSGCYGMSSGRRIWGWGLGLELWLAASRNLPLLAAFLGVAAHAATQLVILGTGTPVADPHRSGPAVAVVYNDQAYLFDAGPGVVRRAAAASAKHNIAALKTPQLRYAFLTHLHSDHTLGLPDLILSPWTLGRNQPLELFGPPGTKAMASHIEAAWREDIDVRTNGLERGNRTGHHANVHEIKRGVVYTNGELKITAFPMIHGAWARAFGYRIDTPDRSIVISGDGAPGPALIEAAQGCDILVHEVYSEQALQHGRADDPTWTKYLEQVHTSTTQLAQIANQTKPKLLVLYHQIFYGATDANLLEEIHRTYQGNVASAHDLDVY
jgi:ribonuclease BN (tRNA processing enzyme)